MAGHNKWSKVKRLKAVTDRPVLLGVGISNADQAREAAAAADGATGMKAMGKVAPALDVRVWPGRMGRVEDIEYCAAWLPPPDVVSSLPNLKVILSLGAGVDAILKDPTLPSHIPIVRVNEPDLTGRMTEYIVLHVLMHHRQQRRINENQKKKVWDSFPTHAARELSVGIMGLGVMGVDSAIRLRDIGFRVAGWSRSRKVIPGVESFAGDGEFDSFLARQLRAPIYGLGVRRVPLEVGAVLRAVEQIGRAHV